MARQKSNTGTRTKTRNTANLGFEEKLWQAADKLRGTMDAAEYKHVVLGLIFLKYISDSFEEHRRLLAERSADPDSEYHVKGKAQRAAVLEDRDEYTAENVFWVPKGARWELLQNNAKQPTIGTMIDEAMVVIEKENWQLKGVLPKIFASPNIDKRRLSELIDLIGTIGVDDKESRSKDVLGRVYEYFLGKFLGKEGKSGGEFYTPACVPPNLAHLLSNMVQNPSKLFCATFSITVSIIVFIIGYDSKNQRCYVV